jgi:hypothetical protein
MTPVERAREAARATVVVMPLTGFCRRYGRFTAVRRGWSASELLSSGHGSGHGFGSRAGRRSDRVDLTAVDEGYIAEQWLSCRRSAAA